MRRIICSLPNASSTINGVAFKPDRGQMVSDLLPDEITKPFASIPGYTVRPAFDDMPDAKASASSPGGLRRVLLPGLPDSFPDMDGLTFIVIANRLVCSGMTDEQARAWAETTPLVTVEPPFDLHEPADQPDPFPTTPPPEPPPEPPPPPPPPGGETPPPPASDPAPSGDARNRGRARS